jgi:coenzyme F420-dependent glucose-6-phosphate dehydrogenase
MFPTPGGHKSVMPEIRYWTQLATEQYPPSDLVRQAAEAERAGFDALNVSDHYQPWWEPGESGHAWVLLGAIGQATDRIPIGTGVTAPVFRHNPAVVAQAFATLEEMFPGRAFVGIGSGEALNESPCGMDWPPVGEQVERMEEALLIIDSLLAGERLDHEGRYFRTKQAYLHSRGERRPPIYVSAFGPRAAGVAARLSDGLWTLADPETAPEVIDAYRSACDDEGKQPGEIILQTGFSWAEDDDAALEGARVWKATQPPEYFTDDWHDPRAMYEKAEKEVTDDDFRETYIVSSDPEVHVERVREVEQLGATIVCLQNASGADPHAALRVYGEKVLPALRDGGA